MDGGEDGDEDDGDSSGYNADDEDEEEEEEEHLALADFAVVIPTDELVSPPEGIEPIIPPPSTGARITIRSYEVGESSTRGQGVDYWFADTVEAEMRHQAIRGVGYGIRDTWIDPIEAVPEIKPMTLEKVNTRVTELAKLHEHDTQDLYALLKDAQDGRNRISQRVSMDSQRVDLLMGDRMTLQETREVKKLEIDLWNLKVKGNDVPTYTNRFQELTLICTKFVANENEKIDKNFAPMRKGLTTKERLMIHPEATMDINNNPSRSRMLARSIIWGREKGNNMKDLCPSAQSANVITMALVLRSATSATRKLPKEMVVLNAELQDISREIVQSRGTRMREIRMLKDVEN
nr:hypothetical protein [Tanacetum cinerariifolium]